jgi:hypothetical protein
VGDRSVEHPTESRGEVGRDRAVQSYRQFELGSDLVNNRVHLCPNCRADLSENVRAHLYSCLMLPEELRRRLHTAREAVRQTDQAERLRPCLKREAEADMAALRETMRRAMGG